MQTGLTAILIRALLVVFTGMSGAGTALARSGSIRPSPQAPVGNRIGGGNLVTHEAGKRSRQMYEALEGVGARLARMNSYGWRDDRGNPTPRDFDAAMMEAFRAGISPVFLLEYEGSYQFLDPPQPIGSYADWFRAGAALARRFRPNGGWGREHGIRDFGVSVIAAINEPDVQATIPRKAYHDALAGLADGVHSIDPSIRVVPGGFATCNSHGDATLRGYGPAIADLLNDGRLDGMDLHTYYNARWFPLTKGRRFSAQSCFDRVKRALGITRNINFYATEFNIARKGAWRDEKTAARLFLTAIWDHLGVVRSDGRSPATVLAFPWYLADAGDIEGPAYALAAGRSPWKPEARAKVLAMVLRLAGDMTFTALDPLQTGTYELAGKRKRLYVFQDLAGWSSKAGKSWTVKLPGWARKAGLWAYDGLRKTYKVHGGTFTINGLAGNETYMLLVR